MANNSPLHNNKRRYQNVPAVSQPHKIPQRMPDNKPNINMKKINAKKGSAPKVFLGAACVMLMLCYLIYGKVQRDQLFNEVSQATVKMEKMESDKSRMQVEIESKMTLKNVEQYAENILKLQKLDKSQIEYVQIQTGDVVEIPEEEDNIFVKIKNAFNDFMEYIFN